MSKNSTVGSRVMLGVVSAALCVVSGMASCSGGGSPPSSPSPSPKPPSTTAIDAVAAAWAAEPVRAGTVHYFCDCGTGASANCVAGNNANSGLTTSAPQQTIAAAMSTLNSMPSGDTVVLCKGGAFNALAGFNITRTSCAAGTTCVDLREYSPTTFTGTAKPIINNVAGASGLFSVNGNLGGVRILNLTLNGDNGAIGNNNDGFFFYGGAHDVTLGNLDLNNFDTAVYNAGGNPGVVRTSNIKLTGSRMTNSRTFGFLGAGINADISYNYWDGNGSSTVFDHTIYLSAAQLVTNMSVVGNYVRGQYGAVCVGAPIVAHMAVDGLLVTDNTVDISAGAVTSGCWGMAFSNVTGDKDAVYFRNAKFSGNTVINGGNIGFTITNCPNCIIENNLVIQNWSYSFENIGMDVPYQAAKLANGDDVNTQNIIRNNTVWFGPNTQNGGIGIRAGIEGNGHIIANNTVYYGATTGGSQGVDCFDYTLPLASYSFINNNHCYSAASSYQWVNGRGTLAAWKSYAAASGFDSGSLDGVDPQFTTVGTNFVPTASSPLIGAGSTPNKSTLDITGKTRPSPPAIGAYEP